MEQKQEPLVKEPRSMQLVQIEMQQTSAEIGFLHFQVEEAMPRQIQKLFNQLTSLQKELDKFMREADEQQAMVEKMKAQGKVHLTSLPPDTVAPTTEVTQ